MIKFRENMTDSELAKFKSEQQALEDAYASATQDALNPAPEGWEDPSDYVGMGWVDSRGRP
jgi:hypothetical protein